MDDDDDDDDDDFKPVEPEEGASPDWNFSELVPTTNFDRTTKLVGTTQTTATIYHLQMQNLSWYICYKLAQQQNWLRYYVKLQHLQTFSATVISMRWEIQIKFSLNFYLGEGSLKRWRGGTVDEEVWGEVHHHQQMSQWLQAHHLNKYLIKIL